MHEDDVSAGRLIAAMFALMRDNAAAITAAIVALSVLGVAVEMADPEAYFSLPLSIAGMIAEFVVIKSALDRLGLVQRTGRSVWPFIGASILINLGVILGLILLVVPGIVLAIRWSVAIPTVLAEEQDSTGSLSESWARTKGHALAILVAYLVPLAPLLVSMLAYAMIDPVTGEVSLAVSGVANVGGNVFLAMNWLLSVAIYTVVTRVPEQLDEIFA